MGRRHVIAAVCLLAAIGSLGAFGIVGIGRGGQQNFDGAVLWAAGRCWLAHANPYDHDQLAEHARGSVSVVRILFFYPPQAAGICVLLGLFKYRIARIFWLGVNLFCVVAIIWMTGRQLHGATPAIGADLGYSPS